MRKTLVAACVVMVATVGSAGSASADGSAHNCAGAVSSTLAQGLGAGFGAAVAGAAQVQAVDNFGLRNCGAAPGQNP